MQRYKDQAIFGLNALFALATLCLLALDVVCAEAALTNGQMMPPSLIAANVGP
jgi:hypothetical protein